MRPHLSLSLLLLFTCVEVASAGLFSAEALPNGSDVSTNAVINVSGLSFTGAPVSDKGFVVNFGTSIEQEVPSQLPAIIADQLVNSAISASTDGTVHFTVNTNVAAGSNWAVLTLPPQGIQIAPSPQEVTVLGQILGVIPQTISITTQVANVAVFDAQGGAGSGVIDPPLFVGDENFGLIGQDGNGGLIVAFAPGVNPVGQTFNSVFGITEASALGFFSDPTSLTSPAAITTVGSALLANVGMLPALNEGQSNAVTANLVDFGFVNGVEQAGVSDGTATDWFDPPGAATPEPASVTLMVVGAAGLAGYAWRRRRHTCSN